ncbi:MAG TPA: DUF2785 domain-containing protein [Xanthomonadales bacterium]|nr:DUF2785 domain-containing protein [Xanthomonadales bacterium]
MRPMPKLCACFLLLASGSLSAAADDAAQLTAMLSEFLAGASLNDAAAHERFWADDLIYTSSSGERIGKGDIMRELNAPADKDSDEPPTVYSAEDIRIQQYGDSAIVAFRLAGASLADPGAQVASPQVTFYYNTGTFLRRDGVWQVVAWQATRIPAREQDQNGAAPAFVAGPCPPPGYTREQLIDLKQHDFALTSPEERNALAIALLACLADPDPLIRDGVAFEGISSWMRDQQLPAETVLSLNDKLQVQIQSTADPNGFQQPFAALLLAEVARVDRLENVLTSTKRDELVDAAAKYLAGVNDYRGFSSTEGWRHGVAHGSDLVVQLVLNPNILPVQAEQLMAAVATQIAPAGEMFYVYGEPGRLARATFYTWSRGLIGDEFWNDWFDGIGKPQPLESWAGTFSSQPGLAKRHNTLSFLLALHINAMLASDERGAALAERVEQAITKVSGG